MILLKTSSQPGQRAEILPKGDRYDRPPGRRQVSLLSLIWLLLVVSVVAALCRWMRLGLAEIVVIQLVTLYLWWRVAEIHERTQRKLKASQAALRQEVQRWLEERDATPGDSAVIERRNRSVQ